MTELDELWTDPDRRTDALARLHERIARPERDVTELEARYLVAASFGLNNYQIAELYGVASGTVEDGLTRARRVLRAKNTAHAVAMALRRGIIR